MATVRAFVWLDEHGDALYAYALRRLGDPHESEDCVQETLLAAIEGYERYAGDSAERTWLIGILRHKVLDRLRAASRRRTVTLPEPDEFRDGQWREAQRDDALSDLGRVELGAELSRALDTLPEQMRLVLILREIDGLPTGILCDVLGVTPTNLWTLVHRAKLKLRRALKDRGEGAG